MWDGGPRSELGIQLPEKMSRLISQPIRLVIIGNGMVGHALVKKLIALGAGEQIHITVIGEESQPAYDRVHLTDLLHKGSADELSLAPQRWYEEQNIDLITSDRVESIDRTARQVCTQAGKTIAYDHCVLATGSHPFVPPIEGTQHSKVFVYRTIEDVQQICKCAEQSRIAAVMGGGLLGLEAAKALYDLGLKVHVFEMAPALMPRQLDATCAHVLRQEVEALGVEVHLVRTAQAIALAEEQLEITFSNAPPLRVDMLVLSAGIRPRDELARECSLACGERSGIAVDERLQTIDPRIYAIGECASVHGKTYGLVGPGYEMARVLAENLAASAQGLEAEARFTGASEAAQLKLLGVEVATLGTPIGQQRNCTLLSHESAKTARTLLLQGKRVVGAIGVGPWPEREPIADLIETGKPISARQLRRFESLGELRLRQRPVSVAQWPERATVCSCLRVNRGCLSKAMQDGHNTVALLAQATGASSVCGSCQPLLATLVGDSETTTEPVGRRSLLIASLVGVVAIFGYLLAEPLPFADSFASPWRKIDVLWRSSFAKQVSGFSLLGISLLGLLLSLRKRLSWFRLGQFGFWRAFHAVLGVATLVGFLVHTGLRMGHNFTFALALTFLALNLLGAFTGIVAALETRFTDAWAQRLRSWRPKLTRCHIWLFWPLPALLAFHIISVYFY